MDPDSILVKSLYNCKSSPDIANSIPTKKRENSQIDHDLSSHHRILEEELGSDIPSLKRMNQYDSTEQNSIEGSFGIFNNLNPLGRLRNAEQSVSPAEECRIIKTNGNYDNRGKNQPPLLANMIVKDKRSVKKKIKKRNHQSNQLSQMTSQMTGSMDMISQSDFHPPSQKEQFSSVRASRRANCSGSRGLNDEDCEIVNPMILRTIQHRGPDQSDSFDIPNISHSHSVQIRKLMNKLQTRLEEEMSDKFHEMERKIKALQAESEITTQTLTKSEIKRLIRDEKDNIIEELKHHQKGTIRKEIGHNVRAEFQELEKKVSIKLDSSYQENFEAIKFLSDKVKQCIEQSRAQRDFSRELTCLKNRINEISRNVNSRQGRAFISAEKTTQDLVWEKVDNKLDKIYEFQQKIGDSESNTEESKKAYNQFGDAIVGLVKNLVKGNQEERDHEIYDFNNMISCLNSSIDKIQNKSNDSEANFLSQDKNMSEEVFGKVMDRMSILVDKWNKHDEKTLTRCGTDKDKLPCDREIEMSEDRQFLEDVSHVWEAKFTELTEEINEIKTSANEEFGNVHDIIENLQGEVEILKEKEPQTADLDSIQENMKSKFEFFAKNINDIYSLMDIIKKKLKAKTQSKDDEVVLSKLNDYGKSIKNLNSLYQGASEINSFCKKTIIDTNKKVNLFIMSMSELMDKGGNLTQEDLNAIALKVKESNVNEHGSGDDIKIFDHIDIMKQGFNKWKNANIKKIQEIQDIENKDVEMLLDKIHRLQLTTRSLSATRSQSNSRTGSRVNSRAELPRYEEQEVRAGVNTSIKVKDGSYSDSYSSNNDRKTDVIVLSEKDINRDTSSQYTEDSQSYNLTPELIQDLCIKKSSSKESGKPPLNYIPFDADGNDISFAKKSSSKASTIAIQGGMKRSYDRLDSREKRNIFAKPKSTNSQNREQRESNKENGLMAVAMKGVGRI
ncbi:unnamed protein product [Moneuplotes crassus]|uniref:Uncharacterized protein n=1 Tax=Euplotes crassus TaxID=5936 RepID=A0AAD1XSC4_EUPCR|nr:unnamed protein product [Moneuplotes crassus]